MLARGDDHGFNGILAQGPDGFEAVEACDQHIAVLAGVLAHLSGHRVARISSRQGLCDNARR